VNLKGVPTTLTPARPVTGADLLGRSRGEVGSGVALVTGRAGVREPRGSKGCSFSFFLVLFLLLYGLFRAPALL
jgi:hypothetical protein